MSKKNFILYTALWLGMMSACSYEDKTTYAGDPMPDILIDTTGISPTQVISREDELIINPKVSKEGVAKDQFEYEWRITLDPGADFEAAKVIGHEETLKYLVEEIPDASTYSLWYRVTDKTTGLMKSIMWEVQVEASSGQGLVVAYTRDGQTTDFAIVQDSLFTYQYYEKGTTRVRPTAYKFDVFSKQNGKTFNGVVKWMFAQARYMDKRLTYMLHGASRHNVFRLNTLDYSMILEGKENFYDPNIDIDVDFYSLIGGSYAVLSNKGRLMSAPTERSDDNQFSKFGLDVPGAYYANDKISDYSYLAWYDEQYGKFFTISGYINSYSGQPMTFAQAVDESEKPVGFNPNDMKGYKVLAGGQGRTEHCFVLEKEGKITLFTLAKEYEAPIYAKREIDITDAPGIKQATSFVIGRNEEVIYYLTNNTVKAIIFSSGTPKYVDEVYTPGEPVDFIAMLKKSGRKTVPFNEKCLLVVTKVGGTGKIHAVKLGKSNTGEIEAVTVLEGFNGQITAVAVQD